MLLVGCAAELAQDSDEIEVLEQDLTTESLVASYGDSRDSQCNVTRSIKISQPTDAGAYPVFVFVTGTGMPFDAGVADNLTQYMAAQGFVAASVAYDNGTYPTTCAPLQSKARCIYDNKSEASSSSAISAICRLPKAACASKGIYVSGFSQGAQISSMAANFGDHMKAAYLIGIGDDSAPVEDGLRDCLDKRWIAFSPTQLREINGERDQFFGGNFYFPTQGATQAQLERLTDVDCPEGTYSCLRADGSGWYIVRNLQLADRRADHCYFYRPRFGSTADCTTSTAYDPGWDTGADPWQKIPSLAWLKSK